MPEEYTAQIDEPVDEQAVEFVKDCLAQLGSQAHELRQDADAPIVLTRQLEHIKSQVFDDEYPVLKGRQFVPQSTDTDPDADSILFRSRTQFGAAKIIDSLADDFPLSDVAIRETAIKVVNIGMAFKYDMLELRKAAKGGQQLDVQRARAARRAVEVLIDDILANGNAKTGAPGFLNNSNVNLITLDNGGWASATPQEILEDLYQMEEDIIDQSEENHAPTAVLFPGSLWKIVRTTQMTTTGENTDTILETFLRSSQSVREADRWKKLETADAAGTGPRVVMYERSPDVLEAEIPQEVQQMPPQERNLAFLVNMLGRIAGVQIYRPLAVGYADNAG